MQGLHVLEHGRQALETQQGRLIAVKQLGTGQADLAGDPHHGLLGLLKGDVQIGIQHAGARLDGGIGGHITQVRRQVHALPAQIDGRLALVGERRALGTGFKAAAVECEGQVRQHLDLALGLQIADERQLQLQLIQHVLTLLDIVLQLHAAVAQRNVVQRKAQGLGRRRIAGLGQPGQHIIHIEVPQALLREAQHRRIDLDGIQDRRQPEEGLDTGIHIDAVDLQLWRRRRGFCLPCARRLAFGNAQITQGQLQRPGPELHCPHMDLATQLGRCLLFQLAFGDNGHQRPQQQPQQKKRCKGDGQPAQPAVLEEKLHGALITSTAPSWTEDAAVAALHQKLGWQQDLNPHHRTFLDVAVTLERQSPEALNRLPGFTAGTSPGRFPQSRRGWSLLLGSKRLLPGRPRKKT
ncbi:MAG: hypothetical protein GAK34_03539 [Delftia tsuruhatensis]|nr:MAG: hypothetical protein GAK34_03539 [Delftia tsuruhatensis]